MEGNPLLLFFKNSAKLTIIITAIQVFTSSFAAYAFAKLHFKRKRSVVYPVYLYNCGAMAGIYGATVYYGWKNESDGFSSGHDYDAELYSHGCFLMRQFYTSIPDELCEAARIDGLTEYGIYFRVVLPLAKGGIATLIISSFVTVWNDFMGPLIYLSSLEKRHCSWGLECLFHSIHQSII